MRVTGALTFGLETFLAFFLAGLCLGRCSAGNAATRESDGATSLATRTSSVDAAGAVRDDVFSATAAWLGRITAAAENAATNTIAAIRASTAAIGRSVMRLQTGSV